jgi:hypothetical protein
VGRPVMLAHFRFARLLRVRPPCCRRLAVNRPALPPGDQSQISTELHAHGFVGQLHMQVSWAKRFTTLIQAGGSGHLRNVCHAPGSRQDRAKIRRYNDALPPCTVGSSLPALRPPSVGLPPVRSHPTAQPRCFETRHRDDQKKIVRTVFQAQSHCK